MHRTAHAGSRCLSRVPARLIAGRRFPSSPRSFSETSGRFISFSSIPGWTPRDDNGQPQDKHQGRAEESAQQQSDRENTESEKQATIESTPAPSGSYGREKIPSYGPSARKWQKSRRPQEITPIDIPSWFLEHNVLLKEQDAPLTEGSLELSAGATEGVDDAKTTQSEHTPTGCKAPVPAADSDPFVDSNATNETGQTPRPFRRRYTMNDALMNEIVATMSGCLYSLRSNQIEPNFFDSFPLAKTHLKLHCPVDGATYFLDKVVEHAVMRLEADLVRIDAQDLAEIAGDYIKEGVDASGNALWTLGYDTQQVFPKVQAEPMEDLEPDDEDDVESDEADSNDRAKGIPGFAIASIPVSGVKGIPGLSGLENIFSRLNKGSSGPFAPMSTGRGFRGLQRNGLPSMMEASQPGNGKDQWDDFKLTHLLESLLESNQLKRIDIADDANAPNSPSTDPTSHSAVSESGPAENAAKSVSRPPWPLPRTIVHIRNFKELQTLPKGGEVLDKITELVNKKRREGQPIMIVGTTSSADLTPELSKAGFEGLQSELPQSTMRTIVVTPEEAGPHGGLFYHDESARNFEINKRHLREMIKRFDKNSSKAPRELVEADQDRSDSLRAALEERPFTFDEVHRIAIALVGTKALNKPSSRKAMFKSQEILDTIEMLSSSDRAKTKWAVDENGLRTEIERPLAEKSEKPKKTSSEKRIAKLRKQCNKYEKRLLGGVVDPENLKTTFDDVHAPIETVESLKMLTTLSLLRPDAFQYGVLATDKITGCLLYGPPGTGKTLLAKAVAKESGATVLEVSGSDVYDMYVGEGEKNVKAIFSLAKKLSPCVVFIDEADAIFASRGSSVSRNSHRELINQFLREWDGMVDTTAFIMVATNRPFDLDDAALRRLPRRMLVDLPTEKDRASILRIHLKDEMLDSSVSIERLAADTKLYSGSDLKNLAVAAALGAVREENEAASKHRDSGCEESFAFPERRVLQVRHFEKAKEEITASVSEDMGTVSAIRKFDERYGDKRGRKKKGGYGFQTGLEPEVDTAKVRS